MNIRSSRSIASALMASTGAACFGLALMVDGMSLADAQAATAGVSAASAVTAPHPIAPTPPDPCRSAC